MLPIHLAEMFYKLFNYEITLNDFAVLLYESYTDFEQHMHPDDYLELITFNFNKSYAMYELHKLAKKYISLGEIETRKLLSLLYDVREKSSETPYALEELYHLYCDGYYFLQSIGLDYGLCMVAPPHHLGANHWSELKKQEQEAMLNGFYPKLTEESDYVISLLKDKTIVLLGEKDENGRYLYSGDKNKNFRNKKAEN